MGVFALFFVIFILAINSCGEFGSEKINAKLSESVSLPVSTIEFDSEEEHNDEPADVVLGEKFIEFQVTYSQGLEQLFEHHFGYHFTATDAAFTLGIVRNHFLSFSQPIYANILNARSLEMEYLVERASEGALDESEVGRVMHLIDEIFHADGHCSDIIQGICQLIQR